MPYYVCAPCSSQNVPSTLPSDLSSGITSSQIASNVFTWATVSVLPFYAFMVLAPSSTLTRRVMESNLPYVALGVVYAYLLYLSWTPDTLRLMFASKYWLPELPGISKMFMNEMTMASAWIHLLAVDLYAARQVFHDGLKKNIETRHSVSLCLLFCPIGLLVHAITKAVHAVNNSFKIHSQAQTAHLKQGSKMSDTLFAANVLVVGKANREPITCLPYMLGFFRKAFGQL